MINEFNLPEDDEDELQPDTLSVIGISLFLFGLILSSWFIVLAI